jgi:hypothetical protein
VRIREEVGGRSVLIEHACGGERAWAFLWCSKVKGRVKIRPNFDSSSGVKLRVASARIQDVAA